MTWCNKAEVEACEREGPFCPAIKNRDSECPRVHSSEQTTKEVK